MQLHTEKDSIGSYFIPEIVSIRTDFKKQEKKHDEMIYFKFSEFLFFKRIKQSWKKFDDVQISGGWKLKVAGSWLKIKGSLFTFLSRALNPVDGAVPVIGVPVFHMYVAVPADHL